MTELVLEPRTFGEQALINFRHSTRQQSASKEATEGVDSSWFQLPRAGGRSPFALGRSIFGPTFSGHHRHFPEQRVISAEGK